jgi:hypothetical protein
LGSREEKGQKIHQQEETLQRIQKGKIEEEENKEK